MTMTRTTSTIWTTPAITARDTHQRDCRADPG
jgi:hypothetical protein